MLEYIDASGQVYSEDEINRLAKEQKLSFNDIVKSKKLSIKKTKPSIEKRIGAKTSIVNLAKEGVVTPSKEEGYKPSKKILKPLVSGVEDFGAKITEGTAQKSFMEYGQSPKYKQEQLAKKEKAKKEIEQAQTKINSSYKERTKIAKEQISFDNRYRVGLADIEEEQETLTVEKLNKKLNQLGIEVEENTFGGTFNFKPIDTKPSEFTGVEARQAIGADFDPKDFKGINDYISKFGDKNYTTKVQERVNKNTPDYISRITPENLDPIEKEKEAKNNLIQKFNNIKKTSTMASFADFAGGKVIPITSKDFKDNDEFALYKEWEKTGAIGKLDNNKVLELDKERKERYIKTASSQYARTLPEQQRKDLAVITQQQVNKVRYTTEEFKLAVDQYVVGKNEIDAEISAYESAPTESERLRLQKKYIKLQDQQQALQDKQLELEIDTDTANEVLLPAVKSFNANYNRFSQLATSTKSTLASIAVGLQDISAYGTAALLGTTQKEVMKNDTFGFVHRAAELNEKQKEYQKAVNIDEIKSFDDFANWITTAGVNNVPSIAMAFTGQAAMPLFFASGYGGKATQLSMEANAAVNRLSANNYMLQNYDSKIAEVKNNFDKLNEKQSKALLDTARLQLKNEGIDLTKLTQQQVIDRAFSNYSKEILGVDDFTVASIEGQIKQDQDLLNLPEYKKFASKVAYGGSEVTFEILGTLKILKGIAEASKFIPKKTFYESLKYVANTSAKNFKREGLSEWGTQVANNFSDNFLLGENKNMFEGGLESFAAGGVMGVGFGGAQNLKVIKRAIASELAEKTQSKRIKEIASQISELTGIPSYKLDQGIPIPLQTPAVQKLVDELVSESEKVETDIINRLGVDLTMPDVVAIGDINRQIREINKDFLEATKSNLDPAQLKAIEAHYRGKFNDLVDKRESILTDPVIKEGNIKTNRESRFEFDLTKGYEAYDIAMRETSIKQVVSNFNNLGNTQSQELLNNAKLQLELEGVNANELTKDEIKNKALDNYVNDYYSKGIKSGIENAKIFAETNGINVQVLDFDGPNANENIINEYNKSNATAKSKKEFATAINNGQAEGVNIDVNGRQVALIHVPNSIKNRRTGVGSHEVLHSAVKKAFKDQVNINRSGENLLKYLETFDPNLSALVTARIDSSYAERSKEGLRLRDEKGEIIKNEDYYEEALNALSDIGADGIKLKTDSLNAVRNFINNLLPKGFPKFKENQGASVYQFVKDYNKQAHFGKIQPEKLIDFSGKVIGGDQEKTKLSITKVNEVQKKIDKLEDQFDNDEIDYDDYTSRLKTLELELKKAKEAPEEEVKEVIKKPKAEEKVNVEEEVKEIIKNEKGAVSSDKVQKIYNEKGVEGANEIIKLFKPITNRIVDKRRDAPGFDKELLTDEIETGDGGILSMIMKYDPRQGTPLAAYINKYLPVRAITASRRVLEGEFKKDVTEEKGLMAEETVSETKEKLKYKNALESNLFEAEELKTIENKIITILRTVKSRIDAPITLNRTVTPLIGEIRDEVGKQIDIDLKTIMGGKKDDQLKKFMVKYKRYVLENMTTTWLMGKDGQGGIPQAIQKQIDGRWVNYPDWVGQKIDREKTTTDKAGRTSGAELVRRLPNVFNNVSTEDYLAQVIGPDGNPLRGRKESLAKAIAEESSFDIINKDFENQGPIYNAFTMNQQRLGVELLDNSIANFSRQVERGNVKFSKTLLQQINENSVDIANRISINGRPNLTNVKQALINTFANWNKDEIDTAATLLTPNIISAFKQFKGVKKGTPVDLISASIENIANDLDTGVIMSKKLGSNIPVAKFFRTAEYLSDMKALDFGFSEAVLKRHGRKEGLDLLSSLWAPTVAGKKAKGAISIYEGSEGYDLHLLNLQKNTGDGKVEEINKTYKKINKVFNNNLDGKFDKAKDIRKSNAAWDLAVFAAEWYSKEILDNSNNYGPEHLAAIYTLLIKENDSVLRSAANVAGVIVDNRVKSLKKYDYDHSKPVSYVGRRLVDKFVYRKNVDLDLLKQDYEVNIIPKTISNKLNELGLKSMMPVEYREGAGAYIRIGKATSKIIDKYEEFSKTANIKNITTSEAVAKASTSYLKPSKGISVFDFDDTVGMTSGSVLYTMPDGTNGKLNAEEFAKEGAGLLEKGVVFDFSEFSKVVDGKPGPMVEKMKKMIGKFGPENFFILTARPANAAGPIHEFLSSIGIDIPLENITGLGSSLAQSKADWMTAKAVEGYNDFYFADDAIQNVTAVKNALEVLDVKSKIQQAKIKFSQTISPRFNQIIEENTGMENYKVFSDIVARRRGAGKNKFNIYVPPSAADFELLLYNFIGKGTLGEEQKRFFDQALLIPYVNGNDLMDAARQSIKREYKALTKSFPNINTKLEKLTPDKDFTYDQALRVAIWKEAGTEIPGLSQRDTNKLTDLVTNDPELSAFKEGLKAMSRQDKGWVDPSEFWDTDTIIADLHNVTEGAGRKKFLGEFMDNVTEMFGKWEAGRLVGPNMNKIEAVYGTNVREALEDSLYRMINGKNKSYGKDKETSNWSKWLNGSTGTIMFLNVRSAALQLIGAVNFLNLRDNNPVAAGAAFANQKQYWSDFALIWNSDKMKERRGGLKEDVASAEIANAAAGSQNKVGAVMSYLLKIGYTPTQLADSFAIASGGAPFYRNRIKTYLKEGDTQQEAEDKAWKDFTKVSDETQQSGDPKDISKQQASPAGRLLLTFQNTAMQQSRIIKKSYLDLKNGRGDAKTHIAKIGYYLLIQNIMFSVLQQGLFAILFGIDEEETEEEIKKRLADKDKRIIDVANGVLDSILRGTGFAGGVVATVKNIAMKYMDEREKEFKADYAKVVLEAANISPPIGSKLRKIYNAAQQTKFDKDLIEARGWSVMQNGRVHLGPMYSVTGKVTEAFTNVPLDRLVNKIENVSQAMNAQNKAWQRVAVGVGFTPYTIGIEETPGDVLIREKAKETRKEEGIIKGRETRQRTKDSIRALPLSEYIKFKRKASEKRREERMKRKKRKMGE